MIKILAEMFSYTFLTRAVIVGILVSLCAALLGVSLVLKRYSMIGDGLSHVGFGALAIATALNMAPLTVSIPVVVAAAFLLLHLSENSKIKGDAAIALISTSSLAIGVVVISLTTGMNTDVCNYMFGSILAMNKNDVYLSIILSVVVLGLFLLFYNKIFAITFDETFARATGTKVGVYNMLIAFLTAVTIVLGMRMMGALLISSLIIFPALSSMRLCKKFISVTLCSAFISVLCFFIGIVISYIYATPTGASVVLVNIVMFMLFWGISLLKSRWIKVTALAVGIVFLAGCSKTGISSVQTNKAGTVSVALSTDAVQAAQAEGIPVNFEKLEKVEKLEQDLPLKKLSLTDESLIEIKEKMFIAQTNDVYLNPEDYMGKTLKLEGLFKSLSYEDSSADYYFVLRYGPGCCGNDGSAGFEVAWDGTFPQEDDWVEAVGELSAYQEDGYSYLYLALSSLKILESRGAEFVSQ
ncbi:MAG: metal ABC transporter permease [Spirochaetaceae bacterium]|nr:metal ABC transporter permease [Spirochaetaceae bacterium]